MADNNEILYIASYCCILILYATLVHNYYLVVPYLKLGTKPFTLHSQNFFVCSFSTVSFLVENAYLRYRIIIIFLITKTIVLISRLFETKLRTLYRTLTYSLARKCYSLFIFCNALFNLQCNEITIILIYLSVT